MTKTKWYAKPLCHCERSVAILIALALVLSLCIVAVPMAGTVEADDGGPTIDGLLLPGEWDSYFWFTDQSEGPGTGYDDDSLPVFTGYVTFDNENLYLAFDAEDNTPNTNRDFLYVTIDIPPAGEFNTPVDALYWGSIPANPSFFGEAYPTGGSFPWDRSQRVSTWGTDGGVITARTITDSNRYYELKIPLAAIGAEIGDTIGLKVQAREGDTTVTSRRQNVNFYPDMPDGITPVRADTRVEVEGNFYHLTLAPLEVNIDIKPGSDPNSINLKSKGVVPVAVLTTDGFDASTVDPTTVEFAGTSPVRWVMCDMDGDGDMDILFHFKTQELDLDENSTEATLTGNTYCGLPIEGTDTVKIVPKDKK